MKNINWLGVAEYSTYVVMLGGFFILPFLISKVLGLVILGAGILNAVTGWYLAKQQAAEADKVLSLMQSLYEKDTNTKLGGGTC